MSEISTTKEYFLEAVRMNVNSDPALRDKLLNGYHPRVEGFITNLNNEIRKARLKLIRKGKIITEQTVKGLVYDFTAMFMSNMETEARRRYESDLERVAREAQIQEHKDMDATLDGKPSGIFEEAGVQIDDQTRQDQVIPQIK